MDFCLGAPVRLSKSIVTLHWLDWQGQPSDASSPHTMQLQKKFMGFQVRGDSVQSFSLYPLC